MSTREMFFVVDVFGCQLVHLFVCFVIKQICNLLLAIAFIIVLNRNNCVDYSAI